MKCGNNLQTIICCGYKRGGDISEITDHLGSAIKLFGDKAAEFITGRRRADITEFGPFSGRRLLEAACTVLLGRIDPFRLLLVKRYQAESSYDIGIRGKLSVQWAGDIVSSGKLPNDLWGQNVDPKDVSRALLSAYSHELFWNKAFLTMQDDLSSETSQWLSELLRVQPEGIVSHFRQEADRLFSALSKGIHTEFVVPNAVTYDTATVILLLHDTVRLIVKMGLVSNYFPTLPLPLKNNALIGAVARIEQEVIV